MLESRTKHPVLPHFRPSCPSANDRYGHLESNALIGTEIGEWRQTNDKGEFQIIPARPQLGDLPQHPILPHFRPSRSSANYRYGHLESNA